ASRAPAWQLRAAHSGREAVDGLSTKDGGLKQLPAPLHGSYAPRTQDGGRLAAYQQRMGGLKKLPALLHGSYAPRTQDGGG
ncbi:MAG: hypothetical protein IJT83_09925, partial [Victivallales bacterium]|nr:hypothetical protein [Victivallales bacterium]